MTIDFSINEGLLTVKPVGRLDSASSGEFEEQLLPKLTEDVSRLVIDMSEIDYISSKGLRVLVSAYRTQAGKNMELTGVNRSVAEVLRLSGMLKVFTVREAQ